MVRIAYSIFTTFRDLTLQFYFWCFCNYLTVFSDFLQPRNKKFKRFDKKEGVEFKLMYRDHRDPLYYDPTVSSRILVPVYDKEALPDDKRAIIESLPPEDRGEILNDEDYKKKGYGIGQGQQPVGGAPGVAGTDLK